jgi:hypothetical protein
MNKELMLICNFSQRFAALCLFALAQSFKFTTNVDGANSTKPLLGVGYG